MRKQNYTHKQRQAIRYTAAAITAAGMMYGAALFVHGNLFFVPVFTAAAIATAAILQSIEINTKTK